MTKQLTNRLKLTKESDDELVDQFYLNWPILDRFAGGLTVADGVTPPDSDLFDGCLVCEATSGKQWIAKLNLNTLTYTKSWLIFPWFASVQTLGNSINGGLANNQEKGFTTWTNGVNSDSSCIVATALVLPIAAMYDLTFSAHFTPSPGPSSCDCSLRINSVLDADAIETSEIMERDTGSYTTSNGTRLVKCAAGDKITLNMWTSQAAACPVAYFLTASLVTPL